LHIRKLLPLLLLLAAPLYAQPANVTVKLLYDDGTVVPNISVVISQVNMDGSLTTLLTLIPDSTGTARGKLTPQANTLYQATVYIVGVPIFQNDLDSNVLLAIQPNLSGITASVTFYKVDGTVKESSFVTRSNKP